MTEFLTIEQVAERLHVSARTVRRLIASGQIRPVYAGRRPLVTDKELDAYGAAGYRRRGAA